MSIAFVHPALMDYRLELFDKLNSNHEITFIFTKQGQGQDNVKEKHLKIPNGWDYKIIRSDKIKIRGRSIIMYLKLMIELSNKKYDTIIASTNWYICFPLAKICGKKFIFLTEYWHFIPNTFTEKSLNTITKHIARSSDAVITTGTKSYLAHMDFGLKNDKNFKCIQCAKDYSKLPTQNLKKELGLDGKKIILYLSRIVPHKGLDYLIRAFAQLDEEVNAVLLIVGEGYFKKSCENLVNELNISNVFFMGSVFDDSSKASYYEACDVFILPAIFDNTYEAWGLVINEALSFSKPIITTDAVGAAFDLVEDDKNGYIVKNKDINELYEKLNKILSNSNLAKKLGENSRLIFEEKNDYNNMVETFGKAINEAIT